MAAIAAAMATTTSKARSASHPHLVPRLRCCSWSIDIGEPPSRFHESSSIRWSPGQSNGISLDRDLAERCSARKRLVVAAAPRIVDILAIRLDGAVAVFLVERDRLGLAVAGGEPHRVVAQLAGEC